MEPTVAGTVRVSLRGGLLTLEGLKEPLVIREQPVTIGRSDACDLRLKDRQVSTVHCELLGTDQGVAVRDLGSTNGTWVNGVHVRGTAVHLLNEATLRVGETELQFEPARIKTQELRLGFGRFESNAPAMQQVLDLLQRLAKIDIPVHITGESGTGKGYIARAIHNESPRSSKPFVAIDCGAIPPNLAEAELFGYERGAFTGAMQRKTSPFVDADGGTVFLDEVGDLPLEVQVRLLRVVADGEVKPVGQNRYRKVDVRVVSATLYNLAERVNKGQFREDLYNRLTATRIRLPPLRERREDIAPLSRQILRDLGHPEVFATIPQTAIVWMQERDWSKGNVRQLAQVLNLAVGLARGARLDIRAAYSLNAGGEPAPSLAEVASRDAVFDVLTVRGTSYAAVIEQASRLLFERLVRETEGNLARMCQRAEVSRPFLREHLAKLGLREVQEPFRKGVRRRRTQPA